MSVAELTGTAAAFLRNTYESSLRDIRRTYQRAFKALMFVHRFGLSARPRFGGRVRAALHAVGARELCRMV